MAEKDLYLSSKRWLLKFLKQRFKRAEIIVEDTHKINLSDFLQRINLQSKFPEFNAYDIKVDITGIINYKSKAQLVFIECKHNVIRLLDVGQLLGYSRVAIPLYSFLLSPSGISDPLHRLLKTYGRYDVLNYGKDLFIRIAKWDIKRAEPLWDTILPPGEHCTF